MRNNEIDITDLRVGNLVYSSFSKTPCKVTEIRLDENGYSVCKVTGVDGYKDVTSLSPIPVTPKILEKNGWSSYEDDKDSFHDKSCVFLKQKDGGYGVCIDNVRTISGMIHYVHELQNALKLCVVDKEITL